jgi:hypothetical protein
MAKPKRPVLRRPKRGSAKAEAELMASATQRACPLCSCRTDVRVRHRCRGAAAWHEIGGVYHAIMPDGGVDGDAET